MKIKDYIYGMKIFNWIKGSALVFIGILITRWGIGFGRFTMNIYFGLPIYFLIASSGMLIALSLKIEKPMDERKTLKSKKFEISSITLYSVAFITSIIYTVLYNLDVLNLFILAFIGVAWFISAYYGNTWKNKNLLANVLISLSSSLGIIYGASLNVLIFPLSIYIFFGVVFSLQFSKDLMNESKNKENYERSGVLSLASTLGDKYTQKISLILDIIVILLILLPIIPNLVYMLSEFLYTVLMIVIIILIGIAVLLTYKMNDEKTYYKTTKVLLKIGMFFVFLMVILANY